MTDVTDLNANPIPSSDLEVLQRNAQDFDTLINGGDTTVENRAGNTLLSYERALQAIGAINNTDDWVTATNYSSNDLWRHTTSGAHYLVLSAYTSGASEAADIALAPKVVEIWQGAPGIPADPTTRPASVIQYGSWIKLVNATTWELTFFDGADDIPYITINPVTNTSSISGAMPTIPSATEDNIATFDGSGNAKDSLISNNTLTLFTTATGPSDVLVADFVPVIPLIDGMPFRVRALLANTTTTPTININSTGSKTIVKGGGQPLSIGDIPGPDYEMLLVNHASNVELLNPSSSAGASSAALSTDNLFHMQDQKTAGTNGGTFTSGTNRTRNLNTELTNNITGAFLAGDVITLPAGDYWIEASCPASQCDRHVARFFNASDVVVELTGTNAFATTSTAVPGLSMVIGLITVAGTKTFTLEHQCQTTKSSDGFGIEINSGFTVPYETYSDIKIWKVS